MIARVALDIALRKEFDYAVPPDIESEVEVGCRVKVPFGRREVLGSVTALADSSEQAKLRSIIKVLTRKAPLTAGVLKLARWIADYYYAPLESVLKTVLPEAVRREQHGWREQLFVRKLPLHGELPNLSRRQLDVWNIVEEWHELPLQHLIELASTTTATVRRLEEKGLVVIAQQVSERDPYANELILPTTPLAINQEQQAALDRIKTAMNECGGTAPRASAPSVFLLHGVTGSGKTEVYLQALAHALENGKGGIVLVPEISLTPQTVERFKARFSSGSLRTLVAVLHSHLSAGERHDEWQKIRQGRARVVIGARSAIFAPIDPLGLIVVDEEHEHSYKQAETPRYHARDVAVMRGKLDGCVVVLGSATPSMETYFNAQRGKYALLEMPTRVDDRKMPLVRVVDMRHEMRGGKGPPVFSAALREAITQRLERREQSILFLNRRGYASSLQCPKCGYVAGCPNCSIALTYHRRVQRLKCHICGHDEEAPVFCPSTGCRNPAIRYAGLGTERVEETLGKLFPHARVVRMDSDTLKRKEDYRRILGDFRTGKIDVLVGTQMIAKGLHFPNVTLVGIVHADLSLHVPDFRAAERTFQLLTQVAGRSGRGDVEGEVVVQAFTPYHAAIQFARRHDFEGFYEQEIEFRQQLNYPPLTRIALLTFKARNEEKVRISAEYVKRELDKELAPLRDLIISGPAPAPLVRAQTFYRYQIMLRTRQMTKLGQLMAPALQRIQLPEGVTFATDIDPVDLV